MPNFRTKEADSGGMTQDDYARVYDQFTEEFRLHLGDRLVETVDSYLLQMGRDPDSYYTLVEFAGTITDGLIVNLIANEWLTLTDKTKDTDEAIEERAKKRVEMKEKREAAVKQQAAMLESMVKGGPENEAEAPKEGNGKVPGMYL